MNDFYAAVFGAGLSGLSIANALTKKGKAVLLIDPYVSENAPGAPAGLVNPATGRHARLSWRSRECFDALNPHVDELNEFSEVGPLISRSGVIRPAINEKLVVNFKESLEKYDWPEEWISWIESDEVKELNPEIAPNFGALHLSCGFTVFADRYLNTYRKYLRVKGCVCKYQKAEYRSEPENNRFIIDLNGNESYTAEHVIVAAGFNAPLFSDWEYLPLHRVKGQIVRFEADHDLDWEHAVSSMGYALRRGKRDIVVGSTYEHKFDGFETTDDAYRQIAEKLANMFPNVAKRARKVDQVAGIRITTPNKLPVIGRHKEIENLCIYTAMGSKGLLFSEYCGSLLADHLTYNKAIPEELDTARFHE